MEISATTVRDLREKTGAGMMDCKKALAECGGDMEKAVEWLKKKGLNAADKKSGRTAAEGVVLSYVHGDGKIGVLVEINCETDFVARTEDFKNFARDIAMHIAASAPQYVTSSEVPASAVEKEKAIFKEQAASTGKPANVLDKIVEGRVQKYLAEICLMDQPFVKEPEKTVAQIQKETIAKLGENISVRRFVRMVMGDGLKKKEENFAEEVAKAVKS
ncbi:MAG: translation elongation factor Ts [Oligoflexia bacterium]|nr:translation elongation factor Ts [Oligoflexia bacterium]